MTGFGLGSPMHPRPQEKTDDIMGDSVRQDVIGGRVCAAVGPASQSEFIQRGQTGLHAATHPGHHKTANGVAKSQLWKQCKILITQTTR